MTDSPQLVPLLLRFFKPWVAYIETDIGWDSLLIELDDVLSSYDPEYGLEQVKEKFGGLRFYWVPVTVDYGDPSFHEMQRIVAQYEALSFLTCEACSKSGELRNIRGHGWLRTLCDRCYTKALES